MALVVAFGAITIILDITEIILFARQKLRPVANIVLQSIKTLFWTVYFCFAIAAIVEYNTSGLSILFAVILFGSCLCQLGYGAMILHRHRNGTLYRGQYARGNVGAGYNIGYNAPPFAGATAQASPNTGGQQSNGFSEQPHSFYEPTPAAPGTSAYPGYQPYRIS